MKTRILVLALLIVSMSAFAQKDWSTTNFAEDYKLNIKMGKKSVKALQEYPLFVNEYTISQGTTMKGSQKSATSAIYSEVSLAGIDNESYQQMVDELYADFIKELEKIGVNITDGEDVIASDYAQKRLQKIKNQEFIGNTGDNPAFEGKGAIVDGGALPGYGAWAVSRDVSFPPRNVNRYVSTHTLSSGLFYQNMTTKENFNLLGVHFYVTFANFEQGRGYKSINLATKPVISVNATVSFMSAGGQYNQVFFKKLPVWGGIEWAKSIDKGKDNREMAEFLGLARSADYQVTANQEMYLAEVKSIIKKLQADIVKAIGEELK